MGIGVSHGTGGEGIAGGCRLRAQNQSQTTGSAMQHSNPQSSSQQQQQQSQQQQQQASASQQQSQQQRQTAGLIGRSKKDNCCLCWCCCCSCSNSCLAAIGGNSTGASDQSKKKGNASSGEHSGGISGGDLSGAGAGNGLDGHDGHEGSLEEIRSWGASFDKLMKSTAGRNLFREFLVSEYSEENIAFWLACEQLKKETNLERIEEQARFIYEDYISILSPKEVSLDSRVREVVNRNMVAPTPHMFDEAQQQIYTLMHRDSYPRFVNSEIYRRAARLNSSGPPSPSAGQEHSGGKTKGKKGAT